MAKIDVLDILYAKKYNPLEFDFEALQIPPMGWYLSPDDVNRLREIATSVRLSSKIQQKYKMIDDIMKPRGFKRFSAGTNRIVYNYLDDTRFLVKIAVDRVGMQDNPLEFKNQHLLKPFVTKMFYMSPCGTVAFVERVFPVKTKEEFLEIADDVFEILIHKILGRYVVEDIGARYFMNWGIRRGTGPVLLDYPYVYKLDGSKLYCNKIIDAVTKEPCNGEIDYDEGFNHLVCTKCGKVYMASELRDNNSDNRTIIIKGGNQPMEIEIRKKNGEVYHPIPEHNTIKKEEASKSERSNKLGIVITNPITGNKFYCDTGRIEKIAKKENKPTGPKFDLGVVVTKKNGDNTIPSIEKEEAVTTIPEVKKEEVPTSISEIRKEDLKLTVEELVKVAEENDIEDFEPIVNLAKNEESESEEEDTEEAIPVSDEEEDDEDDEEVPEVEEESEVEDADEADYEDAPRFERNNFNRNNDDDYRQSRKDRRYNHNKKKNRVRMYNDDYNDRMD